jgi:hypothetical protein
MLDRMSLSLKNGWLDDEGRVFIYFSVETLWSSLDAAEENAQAAAVTG